MLNEKAVYGVAESPTVIAMHDATRLPRDVRIRLVYQGVLTGVVSLVLLGGAFWMLYMFTAYVNDMRMQIREEMRSHSTMLTEHTTFLVEHQRAFEQTLTDHQATMRLIQEGR
jgi:hypothetical protein